MRPKVGVAEGVGEAFLLCCVDGAQFPYALFALALYHALRLDVAAVVKVAFVGHTIARECARELGEVCRKLFVAIGCGADTRGGESCVASDVARIGLWGELALGAECA